MSDTSSISVHQASELGHALERNGWSPEEVKKASGGDFLGQVRLVLLGLAKIVIQEFLILVKAVEIAATAGVKTSDCFKKAGRYFNRDADLDNWLPAEQKKQLAGKVSVFQLTKAMTFKGMAEALLKCTGDIPALAKLLVERGHTVTLTMIEQMIDRTDAAEDVGLLTNGWPNLFFVEDKDGGVSVVHVRRSGGGRWGVRVYRLDLGDGWDAGLRLFARDSHGDTL